jgi:hypothetical protein
LPAFAALGSVPFAPAAATLFADSASAAAIASAWATAAAWACSMIAGSIIQRLIV